MMVGSASLLIQCTSFGHILRLSWFSHFKESTEIEALLKLRARRTLGDDSSSYFWESASPSFGESNCTFQKTLN